MNIYLHLPLSPTDGVVVRARFKKPLQLYSCSESVPGNFSPRWDLKLFEKTQVCAFSQVLA